MATAEPAQSRLRYSGGPDAIANSLRPIVKPLGRNWLTYHEAKAKHGSKLNIAQVEKAHPVLHALWSIQKNLSFPRRTLEAAVRALQAEHQDIPNLRLRQEDVQDYVVTVAARVANLCRSVSQGQCKNSNALW
eukprot:2742053-Alexandrium_andersonii.AAC.1